MKHPLRLRRTLALSGAALIGAGLLPFGPAVGPAAAAPSPISGEVFQDTNVNGVHTLANPREAGVQGVRITVFDRAGAAVGTTTTNNVGNYTLTPTADGPYRVEFSELPSDYVAGRHVADISNGTMVRFLPSGASNVNLAVNLLGDYCQNSPQLATNCYFTGNASGSNSAKSSLRIIGYTETGFENNQARPWSPGSTLASFGSIGATYGIGYQASSGAVYTAAYLRRFVGFGPGGIGQIYKNNALFIDLAAQGINVGADPRAATGYDIGQDNGQAPGSTALLSGVGRIGLGDLDASVDGTRLYTVSMGSKELVSIPVTRAGALPVGLTTAAANTVPGPTEIGHWSIAAPSNCAASAWRPMGIGVRGTSVFVGGACETSPAIAIHRLNPTTGAWANNVFIADISFQRQGGETFKAWDDVLHDEFNYPMAMFSDIVFDGQDLVLGIRDRFGDETGGPDGQSFKQTAGDILRACLNGAGTGWNMESGGTCGPNSTVQTGYNTDDGPGGGEYYGEDDLIKYDYDGSNNVVRGARISYHKNMSMGGLANSQGDGQVITTMMDPLDCNSSGVAWFDNATGTRTNSWQSIMTFTCDFSGTPKHIADQGGVLDNAGFGKTNGLGDIESLCSEAPFEIGNRVWLDNDGDGVQDGGELGIGGVTVRLLKADGTELDRTTTTSDGSYFFSSTNVVGLNPMTANGYKIDIPAGQTPLTGYRTTVQDQRLNGAPQDERDSDGAVVSVNGAAESAAWSTGIAGTNDHTHDFGFVPPYSVGNRVWFDTDNSGTINNSETGVSDVKVRLFHRKDDGTLEPATDLFGVAVADQTTDAEGFYRFDKLAPGRYIVVIDKLASPSLTGFASSTGAGQEPDPNSDQDNNDNGLDTPLTPAEVVPGGIASANIQLGLNGLEPTGETSVPATNPPGESVDDHSNRTIDFGFTPAYSLGNRVWFDTDNNGKLDGSEQGARDLKVSLLNSSNAVVGTAITDANGYYRFDGLLTGDYTVRIEGENFGVGKPLAGYQSSGPSIADPNTDLDNDDNGINPADPTTYPTAGVLSGPVHLGPTEPTGEAVSGTPGDAPDTRSNLTVDFGFYKLEVGNRVWIDANNDGKFDAGETPVQGVRVELRDEAGALVGFAVTDADGTYAIDRSTSGAPLEAAKKYRIVIPASQTALRNMIPSSPVTSGIDEQNTGTAIANGDVQSGLFMLMPGATTDGQTVDATKAITRNPTLDFGFNSKAASIGNKVWMDDDRDGIQDPNEAGVPGVRVTLTNADGTPVFAVGGAPVPSLTTDANGGYLFTNLQPGSYKVTFDKATLPAFTDFTTKDVGTDDAIDSDADTTTGMTGIYTLVERQYLPTVDAGIFSTKAALGNRVWYDDNKNGLQDPGELGVAGVTVNLLDDAGAIIATRTTDSNGNYLFIDLAPGTYRVSFMKSTLPVGSKLTTANAGDDAADSDANPADGLTGTYTLAPGETNLTVDAGIQSTRGALGDRVWYDNNGNNIQDPDEPGVPGVTVNLLDKTGNVLATKVTDSHGNYLFEGLLPGDYTVEFV